MKTFYVPLEKSFIGHDDGDYVTVQGYMPIEAESKAAAETEVNALINPFDQPEGRECLKISDPRIIWEGEAPEDWAYEDWSFGIPDEAADQDWTERP